MDILDDQVIILIQELNDLENFILEPKKSFLQNGGIFEITHIM